MPKLVIVSAGTSQPSTTRMLADRIAAASIERLRELELTATIEAIEVTPLAIDVARASVSGVPSTELQAAIEQIAAHAFRLRTLTRKQTSYGHDAGAVDY